MFRSAQVTSFWVSGRTWNMCGTCVINVIDSAVQGISNISLGVLNRDFWRLLRQYCLNYKHLMSLVLRVASMKSNPRNRGIDAKVYNMIYPDNHSKTSLVDHTDMITILLIRQLPLPPNSVTDTRFSHQSLLSAKDECFGRSLGMFTLRLIAQEGFAPYCNFVASNVSEQLYIYMGLI